VELLRHSCHPLLEPNLLLATEFVRHFLLILHMATSFMDCFDLAQLLMESRSLLEAVTTDCQATHPLAHFELMNSLSSRANLPWWHYFR